MLFARRYSAHFGLTLAWHSNNTAIGIYEGSGLGKMRVDGGLTRVACGGIAARKTCCFVADALAGDTTFGWRYGNVWHDNRRRDSGIGRTGIAWAKHSMRHGRHLICYIQRSARKPRIAVPARTSFARAFLFAGAFLTAIARGVLLRN